jgi:hypothetical protein
MFGWREFQFSLSGKLIAVAITPILLALIFLSFALVMPIITSAQEPLPPSQISLQTESPWNGIHLYASPDSPPTGRGLFAFTGKTPNLCQNGKVEFRPELLGVPAPFEGIYDLDEQTYSGYHNNFFKDPYTKTQVGKLKVECVLSNGDKLVAGPIIFWRYTYTGPAIEVPSDDGNAVLGLSSNSLSGDRYVIVMDANGLPDPLLPGVKDVGLRPYSFRASGLTAASNNDMYLDLYYLNSFLGGADPLTLRIFEWDAPNHKWADTGNQSLQVPVNGFPHLNKLTKKFTTYVLGSTPRWCDSFTSGIGLETQNGITRDTGAETLKLNASATTGTATSKPYIPTLPMLAWQSVSYTSNTPAGTQLTVSVLSQNNQVLKANVTSGQSLADINPLTYPRLKLRVEMSSTSPGTSPELLEWCLLADVTNEVFLPLVLKS